MTVFPALSYTSTLVIPTFLYTSSLKRVPLTGNPPPPPNPGDENAKGKNCTPPPPLFCHHRKMCPFLPLKKKPPPPPLSTVLLLKIVPPPRPVARGVHGVRSHSPPLPPTGPKGPHFSTQGPTFSVKSVKVTDRYIDDVFSILDSNKQEINLFIKHANSFHPTIKFTAEISENDTIFLNTTMKGNDEKTIYFVHSYTLQAY